MKIQKQEAHQMTAENDFSPIADQVLDGGQGGADSGVVGDVKVVVQRDVQIDPYEHPLALQLRLLQSSNTPLGRHD